MGWTGCRMVRPYWFQYRARAKGHWVGQPLIRILTSHFHRHPPAYYVRVLAPLFCLRCVSLFFCCSSKQSRPGESKLISNALRLISTAHPYTCD